MVAVVEGDALRGAIAAEQGECWERYEGWGGLGGRVGGCKGGARGLGGAADVWVVGCERVRAGGGAESETGGPGGPKGWRGREGAMESAVW